MASAPCVVFLLASLLFAVSSGAGASEGWQCLEEVPSGSVVQPDNLALLQTRSNLRKLADHDPDEEAGSNDFMRYVPGEDGTFAQNYQDVWLERVAKQNNWTTSGFFLDLGAFHGVRCSNSALLEQKLGWKGICVEPFPVGFEDRKCALVTHALAGVSGQKVTFQGEGQGRQMNSAVGLLSAKETTTIAIKDVLACASPSAAGSDTAGVDCSGVGQLDVPYLINFVSLDIEGGELHVLETFPWDKFQVGVWVIENAVADGRSAEKQMAVRNILAKHDYLAAPVENPGVDEYFVLPQFWAPSLASKASRVHPPSSQGC